MTSNPLLTFAERLRLLRQRIGLSQEQLGEKPGVDAAQGTVSSWESAATAPTVAQVIALRRLFKVSADYLLGIVDTETGLTPGTFITDEEAVATRRAELLSGVTIRKSTVRTINEVPERHRIISGEEARKLGAELKLNLNRP